jgi:hypothetical protein
MSAMHPESGVPPEDARNSIPREIEQSVNCDELWYSTSRCQPRFDPAAANAMLAELINLINKAEVTYDCTKLDQVQTAVRYLIQRGLPIGTHTTGGPAAYMTELDPTATRYNDYMVLCVVPNVNNSGPVTIDVDGLGPRQVLRNDGQQLVANDWWKEIPLLIGYWHGSFYMLDLVRSQVYMKAPDTLVIYVRTDGNDNTTDFGISNTPQSAYRTLQRAWSSLNERFFPSPTGTVHFILGIPGVYEPAVWGPYGQGFVTLTGDGGNPAAYRIRQNPAYLATCLACFNMNVILTGFTFQGDGNGPMYENSGTTVFNSLRFENISGAPAEQFMQVGGYVAPGQGATIVFEGNGHTMAGGILLMRGQWGYGTIPAVLSFSNIVWSYPGIQVFKQSFMEIGHTIIAQSNVSGTRWAVSMNSILMSGGKVLPGTVEGVADAATFGAYINA